MFSELLRMDELNTENPRIGGSIPPLGTILLDFQTVIRWVTRGLIVLGSPRNCRIHPSCNSPIVTS
jgi:hypothetical protein